MGKSYVENSLKRFLKRKVKITLGFVVAFMITGAVGFAANLPFTEEQLKEQEIISEKSDIEKAEYFLNNYNKASNIDIFKTDGDIFVSDTGKINIKKENEEIKITSSKFQTNDFNKEIVLKKENLTEITSKNIEKAFVLVKENGLTEKIQNNVNNGVYTTAIIGSSINNGILIHGTGSGKNGGQHVTAEGKIYNYGIILNTLDNSGGQAIYHTSNADAYNYGLIYSTVTSGQWARGVFSNSKFYNYGTIISENSGQYMEAQGHSSIDFGKIYNYGIINVKKIGQHFNGYTERNQRVNSGDMINYSIITAENGQVFSNNGALNSYMKNYGVINSETGGQIIQKGTSKENIAENYGVIKNQNDFAINIAENNTGVNYGTVINKTDNVFSDNTVTNKGIVILNSHEKGTADDSIKAGVNKGIIIDKNGAVINDGQVAQYTGGNKNITNTFTDSKTTAYVTGTGNKITENLSDKVIGTVVKDDISKTGAVITADKDLVLENTVITGYFENNGTLLDMGKHNLSLLGDTKLVTSKDNFDLKNVNALNIDGTLKMLGNAEVAGKITGTGKIIEVAVNGENGNHTSAIELDTVLLQNATAQEEKYLTGNTVEDKKANNYTEVSYSDLTTNQVVLDFDRTAKDKENTITFTDNLLINGKDGVAIDGRGTSTGNNININFSSLDSEKVKGDILLGASDDDIVVEKNGKYDKVIDMGAGNDSFTVNGFAQSTTKADNHKELGTFDYKLAGVETITLKGNGEKNQGWHIGENASLSDVNGATLKVENTELHVDMDNNYGKGNVTTSLDRLAGENGANGLVLETSKDEKTGENTGLVKFVVGDKFDVSQKQFDVAHSYSVAGANLGTAVIFKGTGTNGAVEEKDGKISLTVKEASEVGLSGYEGIYNAVLKGLSKDDDLRNAVNYQDESNLVSMIKTAGETAEAFYTTGYAVTKDVTDTYMSVVEDFGRKAGKGEWIAYGKYVNSDTEFDGGKSSKGYDGDITGTVGMIEYGVNETTSYGVVYGQGDTEVDIQGGGKLDGDNTYFGGYVKHRTQNGIDLTGNIGITKSELDLSLATNTKTQGGVNHHIITDGNSDADALTFSIKGTKDYKVTDTIRLQPVVSGRYSFISQDEVTSSDANFKMDEQDITIFEGAFGGNIIKDFDIYNGRLSLSAGAEYVLTDVNKDDNARYHLYNEDLHFTGEEDIADNRIEGHIGIDYEHESGVGVDAKYEMIWTDKGDNSRVTAGISYRF